MHTGLDWMSRRTTFASQHQHALDRWKADAPPSRALQVSPQCALLAWLTLSGGRIAVRIKAEVIMAQTLYEQAQ